MFELDRVLFQKVELTGDMKRQVRAWHDMAAI